MLQVQGFGGYRVWERSGLQIFRVFGLLWSSDEGVRHSFPQPPRIQGLGFRVLGFQALGF